MPPHCLLCFQDLKTLRSQLYSAAEYFESTYTNDDQKEMYVYVDPIEGQNLPAYIVPSFLRLLLILSLFSYEATAAAAPD